MKSAHTILTTLCTFILASAVARAAPVPHVDDVTVETVGQNGADASYVEVQIRVKPGTDLDRAAISRDVKALLDTGRFSLVQAFLEPTDSAVRVVYRVEYKLRLAAPIRIEGEDHVRESRIRDLLGLREGDLVDEQALNVAGLAVRKYYREEYYPDANLVWDIRPVEGQDGLANVTLTIDEGRRARVRRVVFEGNEQVSRRTLRRLLKRREPWDPRWLFRKKRYDDAELEAARQTVHQYYLDKGYLDASVRFPDVRPAEKRGLFIAFPIEEGPQYRFGGVSLDGMTLFPEAAILELVSLEPGQTASQTGITAVQQRITDYYTSRGYLDTHVRYALTPHADDRTVDIRYTVREGALTHIRNVEIRGNTRTRDKVIRRELLIYPGDIYNSVKVRTSERILQNLRYFSTVRSYPLGTSLPDQKDVVFEVEETTTGNFMVGAGFSSIDNLIGFAEVSQGNFDILGWPRFTGGGQKLKLRMQIADKRAQYEMSFVEPWFMDRKLSFGLDLFHNEDRSADYDIERTGGAVSLTQPLPGPNRLSYRYRFERLSDIGDDDPYFFIETGEEVNFKEPATERSSLRLTLAHDTRNRPFLPDRGLRAVGYGELVGGPLGADTDIYEVGLQATHYVPLWFDHVLMLRGEYATVDVFGDTEKVPYADRLFLGGGRTVRGFGYRDIGPKVEPAPDGGSYVAYGGQSMAMASVNYTIPVIQGIRLAAFYDIGNVWRDAYDFEPSGMAAGAGVGIRFDVPGFPIRLDRAWALEKDDERTDEDAWVVWIGYDL